MHSLPIMHVVRGRMPRLAQAPCSTQSHRGQPRSSLHFRLRLPRARRSESLVAHRTSNRPSKTRCTSAQGEPLASSPRKNGPGSSRSRSLPAFHRVSPCPKPLASGAEPTARSSENQPMSFTSCTQAMRRAKHRSLRSSRPTRRSSSKRRCFGSGPKHACRSRHRFGSTVRPDFSIARTSSGRLRLPAAAAHVER